MIELVIYVALFVLLSVVVIQSLIFTMKTYTTARSYRTLQQNGELVMERITREIRSASSVNVASSSFGASPGTLALSGSDSGGTPYTQSIAVGSGLAQLTTNGVASSLSSSEVTITNLTFWNITTSTTSAIKVQFSLSTVNLPVVSSTFYTTVILRN